MDIKLVKHRSHLSWNQVKGELFVINTKSGEYHTFNETGKMIWEAIINEENFDTIIKQLTDQYEIETEKAVADLTFFIDNLLQIGLLKKTN